MAGLGWLFSGAVPAAATAALAVIASGIIVALYFVRLRRREVPVAFAALWLGLAGAASALRRSRRLRHWLSLLLALSIVAALLVGAVDPGPAAVDPTGRSWVILIDRSASMSASDEVGTRLEAARARARALVRGMNPADRALVASFAAEPTAESGFGADPAALERGIAAVAPTDEAGELPRALAFAAAVLRGRPRPTVALISDGGFTEDARRAAPAGIELRYAPVGRRGENVAILSLGARRVPSDPGAVEAGVVVQSFRSAPAVVPLEILSGGHLIDRLRVTLAPGERRSITLADLFAPGARIEARLAAADDLETDDRAAATVPPLPRRRVLRVGDADLYLDGALLSLGRTVVVDRLPGAEAEAALARAGDYDLVIFDGVTPDEQPSSGRFLYFDPRGPGSPLATRGRIRDPVLDPASLRADHPLLRHLDLADVNIAEAVRLTPGPGDRVLAGAFGAPLVIARERPGLRAVVVAFDPRGSDLPMRPAFPLLIANTLAWTGVDRAGAPPSEAALPRDPRESDTRPIARLELGGREVPALQVARPRRWPRAGLLASGLAALLLIGEWISYHRRWTT
ncbi:MAG TPA: VWA domain-containing protein [Polyangia bacterium]|nr:VWA domain-containing protein [Polyangia bacterium]